jgi:hypothetical protein
MNLTNKEKKIIAQSLILRLNQLVQKMKTNSDDVFEDIELENKISNILKKLNK